MTKKIVITYGCWGVGKTYYANKFIEKNPNYKLLSADLDIDKLITVDQLRKAIVSKKIKIADINNLERGNLIDALYKVVSRDKIIQPTFLIQHPIDLSPLARRNDKNPEIVDRFQLIINTWEIINAYSELVDPVDQNERFNS